MRVSDTNAAQAAVATRVRSRPDDVDARLQLFRYAVLDGNWARAGNQLDVAEKLDPSLAHTCMVYRHNILCERMRAEVFSGRIAPLFLGAPPAWLAYLAGALQELDRANAAALAGTALAQADTIPGSIDGEPFDWLADGDSRLGPVLEAFIDGKYYWVPFEHLAAVQPGAPEDMLDLAWCPAALTLQNGGECKAFLPVRYPGSESSDREAIRVAARTEWLPWSSDLQTGLGQRMFVSDRGEYALLDCRDILFAPVAPVAPVAGLPA